MVGMKAFVFFTICFVGGTFLSGIMEGQAEIAVTKLTSEMSVTDTTMEVSNTQDFRDSGYVYAKSERVSYTSRTATSFLGVSRGLDGTEAVVHVVGTRVKNETTNMLNNILGYNVAVTTGTFGTYAAPVMYAWNFIRAIPKMVSWNYSYLEGRWVMLKYFMLWPISAGFVISLGLIFINLAMGIFRR